MRISDWSSDVCSSDLERHLEPAREGQRQGRHRDAQQLERYVLTASVPAARRDRSGTKARKQGAGRRLAWTPPARTPTAGSTSGRGIAPARFFMDLLPTEGVGPLIRAPASEAAASRPGGAPRLGRHPCLTRRRRPSLACFPPPPAGKPRPPLVLAASFFQNQHLRALCIRTP